MATEIISKLFPDLNTASLANLIEADDECYWHHGERSRFVGLVSDESQDLAFDPRVRSAYDFADVHLSKGGAGKVMALQQGRQVEVPVVPGQASTLLRAGLTLCLQEVYKTFPALRQWVDALEVDLGILPGGITANAYVSPAGMGVPKHFDDHGVIVVQLQGQKTWQLLRNDLVKHPASYLTGYPPYARLPSLDEYMDTSAVDSSMDGAETVVLQPGSVLFVPSGYWHQTAASEELSVSLTLGLHPPRNADILLEALRLFLLKDETWRRRTLDGNRFRSEDVIEAWEQRLAGLATDIASADPEWILATFRTIQLRQQAQSVYASREQFRVAEEVALDTSRTQELTIRVSRPGGVSEEIEVPSAVEPVVRAICAAKGRFSQEEVMRSSGFEDVDLAAEMLELLVQEGVLSVYRY